MAFNWFKKTKENSIQSINTDNGLHGPEYLEGFVQHIENPVKLKNFEWRRTIVGKSGNRNFQIFYFGNRQKNDLIHGAALPQLIIAKDNSTGEEITLFDGCKHGYNAIFCESYTEAQKNNRALEMFTDKNGNTTFEITVSTYYNFDFDSEFANEVDENGMLELEDKTMINYTTAKRNGFDNIVIALTNHQKEVIEIISEETA